MRAWKRWSWPGLKVQSSYSSAGPNPSLKCVPLLVRQAHDSSGSTTTLKGELRRLYKLIHPDLLHNQPVQQATNQKSFQLLQEYLTTAKGGDGAKRFIYHFEFYIRSKASGDSLEKVEISLPPPQTRGRGLHEHDILPATRRAMGKLFAACGLSINLSDVEERSSLPELFHEASELQRQSEGSQLDLQQHLSLFSNAIFIGRGVRVLFRAPVEDAHLESQVQLLERMAKAMDRCTGVNLSGSTFIIGNCYKVDFLGRLWLNSEDDMEVWIQFMHQVDLVTASSRRVAAKARQLKEEKVAQLIGMELIFTDDSLALQPEYSFFLQRLEDGAAGHGVLRGGRFFELPVRTAKTPHSLLAMAVGIKQKSTVDQIVQKFPEENYTVMLFHYDGKVDNWTDLAWSARAIHVMAFNQTKWWFAKRFLHPDIVNKYNYIFLWDEDLGVEHFHADRYLDIMEDEGFEISQPALHRNSTEVHHRLTVLNRSARAHRQVYH